METEELPSEENLLKQIMLTSETIWKGEKLNRNDVEAWLENFNGEVFNVEYERKLALWLLANFVYFNSDEVKHLCRLLYRDYIHTILQVEEYAKELPKTASAEILKSTRFYSLGKPGESSSYILYYFRQENNLSLTHFLSTPADIDETVKYIVFVDDVVISGTQATKYLIDVKNDFGETKKIILLTFFSTDEAINLLGAQNIKVISSIHLDDRSKCFSQVSATFNNFMSHRDNCEQFTRHYGSKVAPGAALGYGNGQYTFGFFYNTPDNTLPIFWSEKPGWKPVVKRYDKKYKGEAINDFGKFI